MPGTQRVISDCLKIPVTRGRDEIPRQLRQSIQLEIRWIFCDALIEGLMVYRISSEDLRRKTGTMQQSYTWFHKLFLKIDRLLHSMKKISVHVCSGKNIGRFHVHRSSLYSLENNEVKMMVATVDCVIKNATKSTSFHTASFYNDVDSARIKLRKV